MYTTRSSTHRCWHFPCRWCRRTTPPPHPGPAGDGLKEVQEGAFPEHRFFTDNGVRLDPTADNLAGYTFSGEDVLHMTRDNGPQGDDDGSTSIYYVIAAAVGDFCVLAPMLFGRRYRP